MSEFTKGPWSITEHSWADTSIYDKDGNQICFKSIHDDATEETQGEIEKQVSANFNLIIAAPDFYNEVSKLNKFYNQHKDQDGNFKFTRSQLQSLFSILDKADGKQT